MTYDDGDYEEINVMESRYNAFVSWLSYGYSSRKTKSSSSNFMFTVCCHKENGSYILISNCCRRKLCQQATPPFSIHSP